MLTVRNAGKKVLPEIAAEVIERAAEVRRADTKRLTALRRWGWVVPVAWLRRLVLRWLRNRNWYRAKALGTVQVTTVPAVDVIVPFTFGTGAIIGVGRVKDRVLAMAGQPVVRPTANLVCSFNHKVWDGMRAQRFLTEIAEILETGQLECEIERPWQPATAPS